MIYENQPIRTAIGNVSASDRDFGTNAEVCYYYLDFTMYGNKLMGDTNSTCINSMYD